MIRIAEEERREKYSISDLFSAISDDIFVSVAGGGLQSPVLQGGGERSGRFAEAIRERRVHYRAYAFAARFIAGLDGLPETDQSDTRALMWRKLLRELSTAQGCRTIAEKIHCKAIELGRAVPDLAKHADGLKQEDILVDLPINKVVVRGGDILTRTDGGHVGTPNLFFDPERWSQAYEHQKQCGFVFASRNRVELIALASRIVFFEAFGLVVDEQADRAAKVVGSVQESWIDLARDEGLCSTECAAGLKGGRSLLVRFQPGDFEFPDDWLSEDPGARDRIAEDLNIHLPTGLAASFHKAVLAAIRDLATFVDMVDKNGTWNSVDNLSESQLQAKLREHLSSRESTVAEGSELGGGETDLILHECIVVENKVHKEKTRKPFEVGPNYPWQARRYGIAFCTRVVFVVVGYRPSNEAAVFPLPSRIRVCGMPQAPEERCEVRVVVPWGAGVPSSAKRPPSNRHDREQKSRDPG